MPSTTVNKDLNVQRWLDALRSGKYQQTPGRLRDGNGYCCLGVVCEAVLNREWEKEESDLFGQQYRYKTSHGSTETTQLAREDREALGLDAVLSEREHCLVAAVVSYVSGRDIKPHNTNLSRMAVCMWFNDDLGLNFDQIAEVIERMQWHKGN